MNKNRMEGAAGQGERAITRASETGNHLRRTQDYMRVLAEKLATHPRYAAALDPATIGLLYKSALLHDIGKVGIPDTILLKPGKLTRREFEIMKTHSILGRDTIEEAEKRLKTPSAFLLIASDVAHYHHEKWDGSGYPENLSGDAIPLSAQLMAVADVYDAAISWRVYKPPFPPDEARDIIAAGRGHHFNPDIVDAFLEIQDKFREIANNFADPRPAFRAVV
jgi:putative two-component system response regulator